MEEYLGDRGTRRGHYYTATEVGARLESKKLEGNLVRDSRGVYHYSEPSGTSGHSGFTGYQGIPGNTYPESRINEMYEGNYSEIKVTQPRLSLRRFVRQGIKELKEFFQKKEIKHE